jgi:hypothetical protein
MKRRRSSIPLNLKKFISCSNIIGLNQEKLSNKNSHKESYSIKKHYFDKINTSIPEESESFSNVEETKKRKDTKNHNYYLNYIKNLYENEAHLNKETFIKCPSNKKNNIKKYSSNTQLFKRSNSSVNHQFLTLNFHKKFCVEKGQRIPTQNKMKSAKLNNLLKKKKPSEKEILKIHSNISKPKNKSKTKSKSKCTSKEKSKKNDKKSRENSKSKKKFKESKMKIKKTDTKASTKTETLNSCKIKNKAIKNLFCCFVNENDLSTENE